MGEDASEIREQIAQERAELGETVKALAEKADVKGRVQKKASESAEHIREVAPDHIVSGVHTASTTVRRRPVPVAAAVLFVVVGLIVGWRLRRSG